MEPQNPSPRPSVRFGPYEFDADAWDLRKHGLRLAAQRQSLKVLWLLIQNQGRVVTREELCATLWPGGVHVDFERSLNRSVNKLRTLLCDEAGEPKYIETIPGRGYRFIEKCEFEAAQTAALAPPHIAQEQAPRTTNAVASKPPHWTFSQQMIAVSALTLAGVAVFVLLFKPQLFSRPAKPVYSAEIRSLAVLPLQNLSPDPGQDYFSDGITEEVITSLAQSLPLRVISRSSVMRYKQTAEPVKQIARDLGVDAILEGAVARSGNRVTVTIQLIDAREDRHLWAQRYDRNLGDLLSMEAELSQQIADQVGATLSAQHAIKTNSRAVDPQVHELCLLGRYHWNRRTAADLAKSAEYYKQAVSRDPNHAPAYAGLADAYVILPSYDSVDREKSFDNASAAARHALDLDDTLAEAHATLGLIAVNYWVSQSAQAGREFRRALELNPSYATAHQWFAYHLALLGRRDDAVAEMKLARQLDPLSAIINADEGAFLYLAGQNAEARERLQQAIELAPDLGQPHETLALIDLEEDRKTDALQEARVGLALDATNPATMADGGYVLAVTGHKGEARKLAQALDDLTRRGSTLAIHPATVYVGLGERRKALDTLEEFVASNKGAGIHALALSRIFDALRNDARYQKLMAEARPKNQ